MNDVKKLDYFRSLPYGITLRKDEEGDWVARIEELPGCTAHGGTQSGALEKLEEIKTAWLEDALEAGDVIPEPKAHEDLPSGKWLQRVPRSLHKSLTDMAKKEGVSLNQFVTAVLAEAAGKREAGYMLTANCPITAQAWNMAKANRPASQWDLTEGPIDQNMWLTDPHKPAEFVIEVLASQMFSTHQTRAQHRSQRALQKNPHKCSWGSWNVKKAGLKSMQEFFGVSERADKEEPAYKS